jgi:hypothetical protein
VSSIAAQEVITSVSYTADGATQTYTFPFPYLSRSHVAVYLDNIKQSSGYTFTSSNIIHFDTIPTLSTAIMIQRETPYNEPEVVWTDGSVLLSDDMNQSDLQLLYIMQEIKDPYNLNSKDLDGYIDGLKKSMPCPFGRFSVSADGYLLLDVFGTMPPDKLSINSEGHLIMEVDV